VSRVVTSAILLVTNCKITSRYVSNIAGREFKITSRYVSNIHCREFKITSRYVSNIHGREFKITSRYVSNIAGRKFKVTSRYVSNIAGSELQSYESPSAILLVTNCKVQGGSNMTGTNCDLFTHK
jgi:uncharacterized lipoprotein YehR (DUF1307 family)